MSMNTQRIILGGLAAGVVMNSIDFVLNGALLGPAWEAGFAARNLPNPAPLGWILLDFGGSLWLAWLYAAIRPRFGAGPRTALVAGLGLLVINWILFSPLAFTGLMPTDLVAKSMLAAIPANLAAAFVAGALYKE